MNTKVIAVIVGAVLCAAQTIFDELTPPKK